MGRARAGLPCAELGVQVIAGESEQAGRGRQATGELFTVAGAAGWHLQSRVALQRQLPPARQRGCRHPAGRRGRIRQVQRRKILGHFHQIGIAQVGGKPRHQVVLAFAGLEVAQLVVQIACRLARNPRVVAVRPGAALLAVAGKTNLDPLRQRVLESRFGWLRCKGGAQHDQKQCQWQDQGRPKPWFVHQADAPACALLAWHCAKAAVADASRAAPRPQTG